MMNASKANSHDERRTALVGQWRLCGNVAGTDSLPAWASLNGGEKDTPRQTNKPNKIKELLFCNQLPGFLSSLWSIFLKAPHRFD